MDVTISDDSREPLHLEVRNQPKQIMLTLVLIIVGLVALYFYIGRMTFWIWVLAAAVPIVAIQALKQMFDRGPCLIINEEGIFDKRLKMGTIHWSDIKRVYMRAVAGAYFICLDLSNSAQYLSRQPAHLRISGPVWRLYDIPPINIKVAYMDANPDELFELIMSKVEGSRSEEVTARI